MAWGGWFSGLSGGTGLGTLSAEPAIPLRFFPTTQPSHTMPSEDWIPRPYDEFDTFFVDQFAPYFATNAVALGFTAADGTAMTTQKSAWPYSFTGYTNAKAALAGATDDKDLKRKASETLIRTQAAKIQANPAITPVQKEALGLTVRKTTRTAVPVPSTTPALARVDTSTRAILRLFVVDAATPDSRRKRRGWRRAKSGSRSAGRRR